jgi:hypothetical protein
MTRALIIGGMTVELNHTVVKARDDANCMGAFTRFGVAAFFEGTSSAAAHIYQEVVT